MEVPTERVVELLLRLMDQLVTHLGQVAGTHDLTTMQAKTLWLLDQPCPMRSLADRLHCDASNVTGIIDRLEARELVERQAAPADRRIKQVARTAAGDALAVRLRRETHADIPVLNRLDPTQQARFTELLEVMVPDQQLVPVAAPR